VVIKIYSVFVVESMLTISINRILGYWAKDSEDQINNINETELNHFTYFKLLCGLLLIIQVLSFQKNFAL
jgi:hypothetical protein